MTGLIPEKDFSRRSFIKGGGMMIVGIGAAGAMGGTAKAAGVPFDAFASPGPADPNSPDSFLTIHSDNTASLRSGRIELGQGATVGLMIIAAEELNMDNSQLVHIAFDTGGAQPSPNTGNTGGSSSITTGGPLVRMAAAQAYQALLGLASTNLGVPVAQLSVSKGVVSGGGKTVTYGQLIGDKLLNVKYAGTTLTAGQAPAKPVAQYTQVGIARPPRYDIPIIVNGSKVYAANVRVPGMVHGRIVRPRGQGAYGDGSTPVPLSIDQSSIAHIPGVQIVQKGNFLGVVAPKEYDAIQAAALLKVAWKDPPTISPVGNFWQGMRTFDSTGQIAAKYSVNNGNVDSAIAGAAKTVAMTAKYHYQMHGPIGPNVAVADVNSTGAIIYSHVKDGYGTSRPKIAAVLGLPLNRVRIVYYEGSSSFGGGAIHVDTGESAALMSQAVGKPVRVQYMRWDEHGWDNYGQAMMFDMRGGVDPAGNITGLDYTGFAMAAYSVTPAESLIGMPLAAPSSTGGASDTSNTGTQYNVGTFQRRYNLKTVPTLNNYFKTSTLRAPNAPQGTFAGEQLIDQLAYVANMDPYQFRLQNITQQKVNDGFNQWRDVLTSAATLGKWEPRVANSVKQTGVIRTGRGIAIGGFASSQACCIAEIEVNMKTGKILAKHLYGTQVAGLSVAPSMIENQISGNLIMGTSRALFEQISFNTKRVTSLDWVSYPLLRFADHPDVSYQVVQRTDLQPTGSGEPPHAPVAAAIGNAFFDATGLRILEAPMTAARSRAVLKAGGLLA